MKKEEQQCPRSKSVEFAKEIAPQDKQDQNKEKAKPKKSCGCS